MKNLRSVYCYIIAILFFSVLSPTLFSCSKDDDAPAYITKEQLYGTWKCEVETNQSSYEFYPEYGVRLHSVYTSSPYSASNPYVSDYDGVFYLHRSDEHIIGIYFHSGSVGTNGKEKATYSSFEWLNTSHTRFSIDNNPYVKQ